MVNFNFLMNKPLKMISVFKKISWRKTRLKYQMLKLFYKKFWDNKIRGFKKGKISCQFKYYIEKTLRSKKFKRACLLATVSAKIRGQQHRSYFNFMSLQQRKLFFLLSFAFFIKNKYAAI